MFSDTQLQSLYRYACSLTVDATTAYDLLQDALERFLAQSTVKQTVQEPLAYMRSIIRNRYIDQVRREQRSPVDFLELIDDQMVDHEDHLLEDLVVLEDTVARIWAELNPMEREVLSLWAVEGMTAQEMADQLETPRGTILARIHRLRKKVVAFLDEDDADQMLGGPQ